MMSKVRKGYAHVAGMAVMLMLGVLLMALSMMLGGCRSVRYVPVEKDSVRTEVRHVTDLVHDSVYVETKAERDTVWRTELRWRVRYVDRTDTVYVKVRDEEPKAAVREEKKSSAAADKAICVMAVAMLLMVLIFAVGIWKMR